MQREFDWKKWAAIVICVAGAIAAPAFLARPVGILLLPFLFAYLLSLAVRPAARRMAKLSRLPEKLCAVLLFTVFLSLLVFLLGWLLSTLLREAENLLIRLWSEEDSFLAPLADLPIPFLREETRATLRGSMKGMTDQFFSAVGSRLPDLAVRLTSALPNALISVLVAILAGYYFCTDYERVSSAMASALPNRLREKLPVWKPALRSFCKRYLGAYLKIMGLTALELLLGFLILRVENALLLSLLIAFVDVLPIFGVGTVLIPWAVVALLRQDLFLGVGLLVLCLIITIVRQVTEPRIVGRRFGLHPLLILAVTYAGFRLFGVPGMLISPAVALAIKWLFDNRRNSESL